MGLFDDVSQFLETRLEEFLRNNPHLELQALLEQLREQEQDTTKLIIALQAEQKRQETQLLDLAQDIQTWHGRIGKAESAQRLDLAKAAQEREAALLRQGNLIWGQMEGIKERLTQAQELVQQIKQRQIEVRTQAAQMPTQPPDINEDTIGWNQGGNTQTYTRGNDTLEAEFQQWDLESELERLKREM
jgi:uncharacterized protein (TIGR04376 family)